MVKYVDIKNGVFSVYPTGETLPFLEGMITDCFVKKGQTNQIQFRIEGVERYNLNIYVNTSYLFDFIKELFTYDRGTIVKVALVEQNGYKNLKIIK